MLAEKALESVPTDVHASPESVRTLNLSGNALRSLAGLSAYSNLETLVLDKNGLASLPDCPALPSVRTLWFNTNAVEDMVEFLGEVVAAFPRLSFLSMMNNPASPSLVCMSEEDIKAQERHRLYVIYRVPTLEFLDAGPVSAEERASARERGRFLAVRRSKKRPTGSVTAASSSSPIASSPTPFDPRLAAEAEASAAKKEPEGASAEGGGADAKGGYLNVGTTHYDGRHSEGNRFIVNDDL